MNTGELPVSALQLEALTYPRLNIHDFTLDDNLPGFKTFLVDKWTHKSRDLGALELLPLELLQGLLVQLDLRALTEFRRVSQRALELVDAIPQYKIITTHARNALVGSLSIGTSQFISCERLYEQLCTAECEQCGDFGGYLYLLTFMRPRRFGVHHQVLGTLPHMRSVPGSYGTYSLNGKKVRNRVALVDRESVYHAGIALHGSLNAMEQYVANKADHELQKYNKRLSRAAAAEGLGLTAPCPRRLGTGDVFDGLAGNPMRFLAIVRMPWFNKASQKPEWGFHCIGCRKCHRSRPLHWRRRFTVASFSVHLRQCGNIRDGKHYIK